MEALKTDHQAAEALQAADLNRIESWCQYLSELLKEQGYLAPYIPYEIADKKTEWQPVETMKTLAYTGSEQTFAVSQSGTFRIAATGAEGSGGNAYSGYATTGGKGAKLTASFALSAGDVLRIIVGGQGTCTQATAKDGTSGGGGGCTMILREISSITDSRYQFTKNGQAFEVLLCVAGGGGGNDGSYRSNAINGADGEGAAFKSPSNYTAASGTTGTTSTSSVMGIQQYITNDAKGGSYSRNSGKAQGGYGCGGAADDNQSYGGGWCSGSVSYSANSWSLDTNAVGLNGANSGDGSVELSYTMQIPVMVPYVRKLWEMKDFPTRSEVDRIRRNVDQLQAGFASIYGWREIVYNNVLNFNQMNALEWDLQQLYACLQRILANVDFIRCGEFFGGEI